MSGLEDQDTDRIALQRLTMVRTVSEEDCLLGRGANPRTGTITPLGGSIDASGVQAVQLPPRSVTAPTRWIQRGDQWVSHDFVKPLRPRGLNATPSRVSPQVHKSRRPQQPNKGQRILAENITFNNENRSYVDIEARVEADSVYPGMLPGTFPESPLRASPGSHDRRGAVDMIVKRKPVAKAANIGQQSPQCKPIETTGGAARTATTDLNNSLLVESSLPDPQLAISVNSKYSRYKGPRAEVPFVDNDSNLSSLRLSSNSFSQSRSASGPLTQVSQYQAEEDLESRLLRQRLPSAPVLRDHDPMALQGRLPPMFKTKLKRLRPSAHSARHANHGISMVPTYDNPPPHQLIAKLNLQGPHPKDISQTFRELHHQPRVIGSMLDPFSSVSKSIGDSVPVRSNQYVCQRDTPYRPSRNSPANLRNIGSDGCMEPKMSRSDVTIPYMTGQRDVPPPLRIPRGLTRPHMPSRAMGMRCVPQASEPQDPHSLIRGEQQDESSMINVPCATRERKHDMHTTGDRSLSPADVKSTGSLDQDVRSQAVRHSPTQKSSRYQNGPSSDKASSWRTDTPEIASPQTPIETSQVSRDGFQSTPANANAERNEALALPINVRESHRDPLLCGSGDRLERPSPSSKSSQLSSYVLHQADSSTTPGSISVESPISCRIEEGNNRLTSIKAKLKKHFKHKYSESPFTRPSEIVSSPIVVKDMTSLESLCSSPQREDDQLLVFQVPQKPPKNASSKTLGSTSPCVTPSSLTAQAERKGCIANQGQRISASRSHSLATPATDLNNQENHPIPDTIANAVPRIDQSASTNIREFPATTRTVTTTTAAAVPVFEATRAWLNENPAVLGLIYISLSHIHGWTWVIMATMKLILNAIYVYSKTGKLRFQTSDGKPVDMVVFTRDCLRSTLYLTILVSLAVVISRTLRLVVFPVKILLWLVKYLVAGCKEVGIL